MRVVQNVKNTHTEYNNNSNTIPEKELVIIHQAYQIQDCLHLLCLTETKKRVLLRSGAFTCIALVMPPFNRSHTTYNYLVFHSNRLSEALFKDTCWSIHFTINTS